MTDWTDGYRADILYTRQYYAELNPQRIRLAFLNAGLVPPSVGAACELGFGNGLSVNIHAGASVTEWHGTDFNPAQAAFAEEIARAAGAGARLYDQAFGEFCARPDLPDFDFICLHGIWSWISDENRHVLVDFIGRKLKVGGVLYISYNTQPGWAAMKPMRDLLAEHAETMGAPGTGILGRVDEALKFAQALLATNPIYATANPQVAPRLKAMAEKDRSYLAHEFFNSHWHPMGFSQIAQWLAPAKLQWACSANLLDVIEGLHLTPGQQEFLKSIPNPMFRQTVRDFCVNQQFRKDYWVKGAQSLNPLEQMEGLRALRVVLMAPAEGVTAQVTGSRGAMTMDEGAFRAVVDTIKDHKPRSIGEIETRLPALPLTRIMQVVTALVGNGTLELAQDDPEIAKARKTAAPMNIHLMTKARGNADLRVLGSPVTGGGVLIAQHQQLFLLARAQGHKTSADWANFAWAIFARQGRRLVKEGKQLETAEENLAELNRLAQEFEKTRLPFLKALQIA